MKILFPESTRFLSFLLATKMSKTIATDTSEPYTRATTGTMYELQTNLKADKRSSPSRLKTRKGQSRKKLGYTYMKKKEIIKENNQEHVY